MSDDQWHFRPQRKGDRDRNPIQNEFFASEAVGSLASALVREGTQNSGDARSRSLADGVPVRIRIFVSGESGALTPSAAARWGSGLWDHVAAEDSGLRKPPAPEEACHFVVFEDFGTTGLIGDTECDDATKEPFYCFFRAENTSSKTADTGGSWGVGKTAFPRASRANAFFALSRRETDGRTVLMGSLTLRTRHVNGVKFTPDSWYGVPEPGEVEGGVIQPIEDPACIRQFTDDFHISRQEEPGTSIVVPWCDASLNRNAITRAVIESNFIPIIAGSLEVTVCSPGIPDLKLDSDSIEPALEKLGTNDVAQLLSSVRLTRWAVGREGVSQRVSVHHTPSRHSVKWDQYELAEADRERLRIRFDDGLPIAVRIPVPLHQKDEPHPRTSHLDVFLQRTADGSTIRPVFARGSVVIPDHKIKRVPGAIAIIRSSKDGLGNLLRAAEDPGHKEWSTETDNFAEMKASFKYARSYLPFARDAALRSSRLMQELGAEEDIDLLADVFSLAKEPEDDPRRKSGARRRTKRKKKPEIEIERKPKILQVTRNEGGFTVSRAGPDSPIPARIRIRAAYDVRSRDPFKQWEPIDFEFGKRSVKVTHQNGLDVAQCVGNRMVLNVVDDDYQLQVSGFDTERGDLVIDVRPEGRLHDQAT